MKLSFLKNINIICISLLLFSSCATVPRATFSSFYDPWHEVSDLRGVIILQEGEEPKIIRGGSNVEDDLDEILSYNYTVIGKTSFNGPNDDDITTSIKNQCRKNGATIALYVKDYTDTRSGIIGSGSYYSSYNIRRFDHTVYYFVQNTWLPALGWKLADLNNKERQVFERNTGAIVRLVLKNTSVFNANIIKNDIIVRINEYKINNLNDFFGIYSTLNPNEIIEVEYIRNNRSNIVNIMVE